jgi:hypothetical protein
MYVATSTHSLPGWSKILHAAYTIDNVETNSDERLLQPSVSLRLVPKLHEYKRSRWLLTFSSKSGRNI